MKIYVCYGTWTIGKPVHAHPCGEAHQALSQAGHHPEVVRSYGLGALPGPLNDLTPGRRKVKELTGNYWVPVLVLDDGTAIAGLTADHRMGAGAPGRPGRGSGRLHRPLKPMAAPERPPATIESLTTGRTTGRCGGRWR